MAAAKKEIENEFVVFYITRLNGDVHAKNTPIHYPHLRWEKGRTKEEDAPDESDNVEFNKGRLALHRDDWRVEWMKAYNDGGTIEVNGKKVVIKGDRSMFIITTDDPYQKVKIQEKIVTNTVEKRIVGMEFAKLLTTDQLEQLCIGNGIDITKYNPTPEGLIKALEDNGNIAK